MPKYLIQVPYTSDGAKGLLREGGSQRRAAARNLVESLGGTLDVMYFAFGDCGVVKKSATYTPPGH